MGENENSGGDLQKKAKPQGKNFKEQIEKHNDRYKKEVLIIKYILESKNR